MEVCPMKEPLPPGDEPPNGHDGEDYGRHFERLTEIAVREYGLERAAAEELAHDILLGFLRQAGRVAEPAQWLDATMHAAGKKMRGSGGQR
jgi:hypothetical protein